MQSQFPCILIISFPSDIYLHPEAAGTGKTGLTAQALGKPFLHVELCVLSPQLRGALDLRFYYTLSVWVVLHTWAKWFPYLSGIRPDCTFAFHVFEETTLDKAQSRGRAPFLRD